MSLDPGIWQKVLMSPERTVQDAIQNLDESGLQIVLVVNSEGELGGTVTDGDIRRALLRGRGLDTSIGSIISINPMVVPPDMSRELVLELMRVNKIHQLPVVDGSRKVIGLHVWDELVSPKLLDNTMVIMAGGLGKRLRPYTEDCPKPMLLVGGKPILEHIIERARSLGFRRFILSINYLGHLIEEYFGSGERWQISIDYLREQSPLGTAGALSLLDPRPNVPFLVTNGDVLTDVNYADMLNFHIHHRATATMAVRQHEWQHPFGVVHTEGLKIVGFEEKPIHRTYVNAGIYVVEPEIIDYLAVGGCCDMPTLFERVQTENKNTLAYPMHEPWLDVGRPSDLALAQSTVPNTIGNFQ